jgi:uncharacterized membrane protein
MTSQHFKSKTEEMKTNLVIMFLAFVDKRIPWYVKALIFLLPAGIALKINLIPDDIISECRENQNSMSLINIKGIYAGIAIFVMWLMLVFILIKIFVNKRLIVQF